MTALPSRLLVLLVAVCAVAACTPASAEPEDGLPLVDVGGSATASPVPVPPDGLDLDQLEELEHSALDWEVHEVVQQLQALADADGGGIPALERDPDRITLYWSGPVPQAIEDVIAANADVVPVEVVPTTYRYGDLLEEAHRLIEEHQPAVAAVGPRPTADGIDITIRPSVAAEAGGLDAVVDGIDSPYPLFAETGDVVPISLP